MKKLVLIIVVVAAVAAGAWYFTQTDEGGATLDTVREQGVATLDTVQQQVTGLTDTPVDPLFAESLSRPSGITQLADGRVLVAEYDAGKVSAFAAK